MHIVQHKYIEVFQVKPQYVNGCWVKRQYMFSFTCFCSLNMALEKHLRAHCRWSQFHGLQSPAFLGRGYVKVVLHQHHHAGYGKTLASVCCRLEGELLFIRKEVNNASPPPLSSYRCIPYSYMIIYEHV